MIRCLGREVHKLLDVYVPNGSAQQQEKYGTCRNNDNEAEKPNRHVLPYSVSNPEHSPLDFDRIIIRNKPQVLVAQNQEVIRRLHAQIQNLFGDERSQSHNPLVSKSAIQKRPPPPHPKSSPTLATSNRLKMSSTSATPFPKLPAALRRGRSGRLFSYIPEPLGAPIHSKFPYSFVELLERSSQSHWSSEQVDFVYRGEMNQGEQDTYIDNMYIRANVPLEDTSHPFDGPLSPLPARWELGEVDLDFTTFVAVPSTGPAAGADAPAGDDSTSLAPHHDENPVVGPASPVSVLVNNVGTGTNTSNAPAPASPPDSLFDTEDIDNSQSSSDSDTDSLFSSDKGRGNPVTPSPSPPATAAGMEIDSPGPARSETSLALEQLLSSPLSVRSDFSVESEDTPSPTTGTSLLEQLLPSPLSVRSDFSVRSDSTVESEDTPSPASTHASLSPEARLLSEVSAALLQLVSTPVRHPVVATMSPSDSDTSMEEYDQLETSPPRAPTHSHPTLYDYNYSTPSVRSDGSGSMEYDQLDPSPPRTPPHTHHQQHYGLHQYNYTPYAHSEGSMEYDQLDPSPPRTPPHIYHGFQQYNNYSTPSAHSDGSMEYDQLDPSPPHTPLHTRYGLHYDYSQNIITPSVVSDASMQFDQLASPPRTPPPTHHHALNHTVSTPSAGSDVSMEYDPRISTPPTPGLVYSADTSLEQDVLHSPPQSPLPLLSPFTLKSSQDAPFTRPSTPSPTGDFFMNAEPVSPPGIFKRWRFGPRADSPTVEPRRLITYLKRDRERYGRHPEAESSQSGEAESSQSGESANVATAGAGTAGDALDPLDVVESVRAGRRGRKLGAGKAPERVSLRLRRGRVDDLSKIGVNRLESFREYDHFYIVSGSRPRPLVDRDDFVVGLVACGPRALDRWWELLMWYASSHSLRLYRCTNITFLGLDESFTRWGIWYGKEGPYQIPITGAGARELRFIMTSAVFKAISEYQNHLYRLYFPVSYAYMADQMDTLLLNRNLSPPYVGSVFTNAELRYSDGASHEAVNDDAAVEGIHLSLGV
ncbi:hypothetical protein R3P38DRAFT_3239331 [Favolaschia claudopus]|uniref:Uncharacterized protein n=1 Tax=Favolaschia claudopus TaxID=2862362 RepID=A0AAV9Z8X5_9AGAR